LAAIHSVELVVRGMQQGSAHNPNEISAFHPELILREVPGCYRSSEIVFF
jgi:hypothetical protein